MHYLDEDVEHDEVLPGVVQDGLLHRALPRRAVRDGVAAAAAKGKTGLPIIRADIKSQVRQCLDFCTADFLLSLAYESADKKAKHCLT